jgi:hypothetical protein
VAGDSQLVAPALTTTGHERPAPHEHGAGRIGASYFDGWGSEQSTFGLAPT